MTRAKPRDLEDRLRRATAGEMDREALAEAIYAGVARHVPFEFACFATTDPATGVITWASKTRPLEIGGEEWASFEYGEPDVNLFAEIARRDPPVGVLSIDTGGDPDSCRRHREYMAPHFGFTDELRVAFRSRSTTWAALAPYRGAGDPPCTAAEAAEAGSASGLVADAVQRSLFRRGPVTDAVPTAADGPAVLIVDAADRVTHVSPAARAAVEEIGGWDRGSLPDNVLAVVASTRSRGAYAETRTQGTSGRWLSLRGAPLDGGPGRSDVVVTVEPTPAAVLSRLALAAHGLTAREEEVAVLVLQGADTKGIASSLHLSPHTVQDHLKTIFAKLGVTSRREMTARLVLT